MMELNHRYVNWCGIRGIKHCGKCCYSKVINFGVITAPHTITLISVH